MDKILGQTWKDLQEQKLLKLRRGNQLDIKVYVGNIIKVYVGVTARRPNTYPYIHIVYLRIRNA